MLLVKVLILSLCITTGSSAQSDNPLLGPWHCATRETVKDITGRVLSSGSAGDRTLDFRDDQTASVSDLAESGKTILRLNGRWSGKANKLTLQVEGEPSFTGSINKAGSLVLRGEILNRDPDILRLVEWTCAKRPQGQSQTDPPI